MGSKGIRTAEEMSDPTARCPEQTAVRVWLVGNSPVFSVDTLDQAGWLPVCKCGSLCLWPSQRLDPPRRTGNREHHRQAGYRGRLRQLHSDVDELVLQRLLLVQQLLRVGGLASEHLQFLVGPHQGTFQALLKKGRGAAVSSPEISPRGLLAAQA